MTTKNNAARTVVGVFVPTIHEEFFTERDSARR